MFCAYEIYTNRFSNNRTLLRVCVCDSYNSKKIIEVFREKCIKFIWNFKKYRVVTLFALPGKSSKSSFDSYAVFEFYFSMGFDLGWLIEVSYKSHMVQVLSSAKFGFIFQFDSILLQTFPVLKIFLFAYFRLATSKFVSLFRSNSMWNCCSFPYAGARFFHSIFLPLSIPFHQCKHMHCVHALKTLP